MTFSQKQVLEYLTWRAGRVDMPCDRKALEELIVSMWDDSESRFDNMYKITETFGEKWYNKIWS